MYTEQHISDTAFLVNESRARKLNISQDIYAEHWIVPEHRERIHSLWDDFAREVYPYDDIELSVRNRYFLENLKQTVNSNKNTVFINLGAGFTSYPFLLKQAFFSIEVDYHHVVSFKRDRIKHLQKGGVLPYRSLEFISADLSNADDRKRLKEMLIPRVKDKVSFFLLEGVSYYLPMCELLSLVNDIRTIQTTQSIFAFDFWKPALSVHPIFIKLQTFFADRFGFKVSDYNLFDFEFIKSIKGYKLVETSDAVEQERIFAGTNILSDYNKILPENYAVLVRQ